MSNKTEQLSLDIRRKDVLLTYIFMFNIQKSLYAIEHVSHLGVIDRDKKELIKIEIDKIKNNLDIISDGLNFNFNFITLPGNKIIFFSMLDDLRDLIKEVKSDIELTGEFHQCVVDASDKILNTINKLKQYFIETER